VALIIKTVTTIVVEVTTQIGTDSKTGSMAGPATRKNKVMTSQKKNDNLH